MICFCHFLLPFWQLTCINIPNKNLNGAKENDLVFVSPILELAYRKMALCEEKLGNIENQQMYINKAKEISSSINIDYEQLVYFGY